MTQLRKVTESGAVHDEREIAAVLEVLNETTLDLGPRVEEFERRGAELLAKAHGVFVNSGSSALRLAIDLLGCEPGDEVITPALTFSTDVAPLVQSGIVPAFVDVEAATLQIDVSKIEEMIGPRTKGMLIPNLVGNIPDWDAIAEIAAAHDLPIIEDSCDVLDSYLRGRRTGERVPITVTSFARSHAMTAAGMGGMIAINDDDWYDRTLQRRRWGRRSESFLYGTRKDDPNRFGTLADGTPYDFIFVFDETGYNFEPSELMAAYGLVQMDKLPDFNARRRHNFEQLDDVFAEHEDLVERPRTTAEADTIWMRYPFILRDGIDRTSVQTFLAERNISTRMVWTGNILRQPGFAGIDHRQPADGLPDTDRVMDRALTLPIHHGLTSDDIGYITESLADLFRTL